MRCFKKKLKDRGLSVDFAKTLILSGLFSGSKPQYPKAGVAWFMEKAFDLTDEFLAYQEWRGGISAQWKEEWSC